MSTAEQLAATWARRAPAPKPHAQRMCEGCGAGFVPKRTDQRYCSTGCRDRAKEARRVERMWQAGLCRRCRKNPAGYVDAEGHGSRLCPSCLAEVRAAAAVQADRRRAPRPV